MSVTQKQISGEDFRKLFEGDAPVVAMYQIGFALVTQTNNVEDAVLGGSGTLVAIDERKGILTADHVIQNLLAHKGPVGLILTKHGQSQIHRILFMPKAEQCVVFSKLPYSASGPDLAFVQLDHETIDKLSAKKSFYNLAKRRDYLINDPPPADLGAWIISGMPSEWTADAESHAPFGKLKIFKGMIGEVRLGPTAVRFGLDYQNVYVQVGGPSGWPHNYEGYSGSGIWQIRLNEVNGKLEICDRLLSGVAFFQSDPFEQAGIAVRELSCHGRQSIYSSLIDAVRTKLHVPSD